MVDKAYYHLQITSSLGSIPGDPTDTIHSLIRITVTP